MLKSHQFVRDVTLLREQVPGFDVFPFCVSAIQHLEKLALHPAVTFLIGENGCGKSTLLEALAVAFGLNPEGGSINLRFSSRSTHSNLHNFLRLTRGVESPRDAYFLRAESFYNVASQIDDLDENPDDVRYSPPPLINSYGGLSLHNQSHGESFLALFINRFGGRGFYVLDEPEAALSPTRQMAFVSRLHQLVTERSQFVIATHSPVIMSYPNAKILSLDEAGMHTIEYEDTEHFAVMKQFMTNHERMLRMLMEDE